MKKKLFVVLGLMIVLLATGAYAADMATKAATDMATKAAADMGTKAATDMGGTAATEMGGTRSSAMSGQVFKASNLIGANVRNMQGEDLGKISDLAINPEGNVIFAVVSYGGTLGIGSKLVPVPISALQIDPSAKTARLDISREKMASAPTISGTNWADIANRQWTEDTYRYYGVSPAFGAGGMGGSGMMSPHEKATPHTPTEKSGQY